MKKVASAWERERQRLVAVLQPVLSTNELRNEWAYDLVEITESCEKVAHELMEALLESPDNRDEVIDRITDLVEEAKHLSYHLDEFRKKYDSRDDDALDSLRSTEGTLLLKAMRGFHHLGTSAECSKQSDEYNACAKDLNKKDAASLTKRSNRTPVAQLLSARCRRRVLSLGPYPAIVMVGRS